jgi:hypothetical protein
MASGIRGGSSPPSRGIFFVSHVRWRTEEKSQGNKRPQYAIKYHPFRIIVQRREIIYKKENSSSIDFSCCRVVDVSFDTLTQLLQSRCRDGAMRGNKLAGSCYSANYAGSTSSTGGQVRHVVQRSELPLAKRRSRTWDFIVASSYARRCAAQCLLSRSCLV